MSSSNGDQQQPNRRSDEDDDDHSGGGGSRSRSPSIPHSPRGAAVPSFLKRNVIGENTGISFGCGGPDANVPGATRRVGGGGISFATFPSAAAPSFASPATMGPTVSALSSKAAAASSSAAATAASSEQQDDDEGSWKLASVPTLPEFHPLERTATFVADAADDPSVVSSRISRVLRDRSIEATYDSSKAKVRCVSMDGVDFRIRLYRGRAPQYAHGIIVEVQRRFGMSFTFHRDTQAVLDAAHGRPTSGIPAPSTGANGAAPLPLVSDSEDLGTDSEQDSAASTSPPLPSTSSMAMVATMFGHPGYDSHYLAYQTLIPLTSAARMGRATAKSAANQLLQPGNPVGAKVLDAILHAPVAPPPPSSNKASSTRGSLEDDSDDEDEDESGHHDDELATKLQTMAWTVLSNAVHATKGQAVGGALREELRPALLRALDGAAANPRHAQMAALCAEFLCLDGSTDDDDDDVLEALERAVQVGRAKHAGLKAQAHRCLDRARRM